MALPLSLYKSFSMRDLFQRDPRPTPGSRKSESLVDTEEDSRRGRFIDIMGNIQYLPPGMVQAVRINPHTFVLSEARLKFEEFLIPANDPIFLSTPSSLTTVMSLDLVHKPDTISKKALRRLSDINVDAQSLFRNCNVQCRDHTVENEADWDHQFGKYELDHDIIGPMILARKDKQPLHVLHAMAIIAFAEKVMAPLFDHYQRQRNRWADLTHFELQWEVMAARFEIARHAKKDEFIAFWCAFRKEKLRGHPEKLMEESDEVMKLQMEMWICDRYEFMPRPEWANVPGPYDVGKRASWH